RRNKLLSILSIDDYESMQPTDSYRCAWVPLIYAFTNLNRFRWFLRCQCLANALVACASHFKSAARSATSTAAKYLGAFAAGFPNGKSNLAAISAETSCSCTPRSTDVSVVFRRAGKRRQFKS